MIGLHKNKKLLTYYVLLFLGLFSFLNNGCTNQILIRDANLNSLFEEIMVNNEYSFFADQDFKKELTYNWDARTYGSFSNITFKTFDKYLITSDLGGRVSCFNIENGKKIGDVKYNGEISQAVVIDKFKIFFIVNNYNDISSTFVVYNYKNGEEEITKELYGNFSTELIFFDDHIYAISNLGVIYKFNLNAWILWEKDFDVEVSSDPISDTNNLYFASTNGQVLSVDLKEGNLNYNKKITNEFHSGISIDSQNLYIGDDGGTMFSIDKNDGNVKWTFSSKTKIVNAPAVDDSSIYFGNLSGNIFSVDKTSGKLNWISNSNGLVNTAPLALNNCIIQPNLNKHVDVLNKQTGEVIQKIKFDGRCRTTPTFYKGDLFFGVDKGEVFSYKLN